MKRSNVVNFHFAPCFNQHQHPLQQMQYCKIDYCISIKSVGSLFAMYNPVTLHNFHIFNLRCKHIYLYTNSINVYKYMRNTCILYIHTYEELSYICTYEESTYSSSLSLFFVFSLFSYIPPMTYIHNVVCTVTLSPPEGVK